MYVAILGRQPALGIAELERVFGGSSVKVISSQAATVDSDYFDIQKLGGSPKAGIIVDELPKSDWHKVSQKVVQYYSGKWSAFEGKITLGISVYGFDVDSREVQKTGIILKQKLKKSGVSLRLVPNPTPALNSAVSHHNKLGLSPNKVEILIVKSKDNVIIAESTGSQNITAYANRDQMRPKRDAFVGMLPPKLAQIMINLAVGDQKSLRILDPFCGTGVIMQEAALMGYSIYGTDLSEKMVRYCRDNLNWLADSHHVKFDWYLHEGDAVKTKWQQPIDAIVSEVYLGQPFSAPPSPTKLEEVKQNCNHIISEFLKNLAGQIKPGTLVCIAVPAWRDKDGKITHLPLISTIARLDYKPHEFANISQGDLLYFRENQVVARELLVLTRV
ncbi:MAG: methyltransferase domain-containing protein [Candidatus Saccharibacteria bacterium]|nr:methyltransferase domain-containing protein [Candidatus Saccharibacteria bacterium]